MNGLEENDIDNPKLTEGVSEPMYLVEEQESTALDELSMVKSQTEPREPDITADVLRREDLDLVFHAIQGLQESFDSKLRYDETKDRVIDTLHKELQTYRDGMVYQVLRPLVLSMIQMHDDLTALLAYNREGEDAAQTAARLRGNLASFQESIESVLEHHGVEAFTETGSTVNPQRQRVLRAEPTSDLTLDRQVSRHIRKGFTYEGRVIRPEFVNTYQYQPEEKTDKRSSEK